MSSRKACNLNGVVGKLGCNHIINLRRTVSMYHSLSKHVRGRLCSSDLVQCGRHQYILRGMSRFLPG